MTFQMGDGRIGPLQCVDENSLINWSMDVANFLSFEFTGTDEKFAETEGGTAGYWDEKVTGLGAFEIGVHQEVLWQINEDGTITLFTVAGGEGGGDTYQVKIASGGVAGYLESKIHADTWEPTDTYGSGTHFVVQAAPVSDAVRFYLTHNIIKTAAGDGSPGMLFDKFNETGTYNSSNHILSTVQNLGSKLRIFSHKSDINTLIAAYVSAIGIGVRFCKVTPGDVAQATYSADTIAPGACAAMGEFIYNSGTGNLELGANISGIKRYSRDPVFVGTGRFKIGVLLPLAADPTKLVLFHVDCWSFEDDA